jgi:hypothetical protein
VRKTRVCCILELNAGIVQENASNTCTHTYTSCMMGIYAIYMGGEER